MFYLENTHQLGLGPRTGSTSFIAPATQSLSRAGEYLGSWLIPFRLGSNDLNQVSTYDGDTPKEARAGEHAL